jgi:hypothetical protein
MWIRFDEVVGGDTTRFLNMTWESPRGLDVFFMQTYEGNNTVFWRPYYGAPDSGDPTSPSLPNPAQWNRLVVEVSAQAIKMTLGESAASYRAALEGGLRNVKLTLGAPFVGGPNEVLRVRYDNVICTAHEVP